MANVLLGVNIDHVASLRNSRGTVYPDPIYAAFIVEQAGADAVTVHLREDRRHITDRDVQVLCQILDIRINLEMAISEEMLAIACKLRPNSCCLVPENRQEVTTESGLDVVRQREKIRNACDRLKNNGIKVSLFIDPDEKQVKAAEEIGVSHIEVHTGYYANAKNDSERKQELERISKIVSFGSTCNLKVNAGHGLHYKNVQAIASLPEINELNIGHSIISRAVINGLKEAVIEMKRLILEAS